MRVGGRMPDVDGAIGVRRCTVVQRFWRGMRARASANNESWHQALVGLTLRNKRRYGGYIIHVGIVLMAIGITGSSVFQSEVEATLRPGETVDIGTTGSSTRSSTTSSRAAST